MLYVVAYEAQPEVERLEGASQSRLAHGMNNTPPWVYVEDLAAHEGKHVTVKGWLAARRSSGKLHFLQVRDGTGTVQCVVSRADVPPDVFTAADHLGQESSVTVTGTVRADPRAPIGYEIGAEDITSID